MPGFGIAVFDGTDCFEDFGQIRTTIGRLPKLVSLPFGMCPELRTMPRMRIVSKSKNLPLKKWCMLSECTEIFYRFWPSMGDNGLW